MAPGQLQYKMTRAAWAGTNRLQPAAQTAAAYQGRYAEKRMTWELSRNELVRALSLDSDERYAYAVDKIREFGEIWSLLTDDDWVLGENPDGRSVFPIWPHKKYAIEVAEGKWGDSYPERITIEDWLERLVGLLEEYNAILGVMTTPEPGGRWVSVPVSDFTTHILGPRMKRYRPVATESAKSRNEDRNA